MARKEKEYKRLPGRKVMPLGFGRMTLWLGKDHLLFVNNRGYSEDYKRFYYRDIQGVLIQRTGRWKIVNVVLGSIAGFFALIFGLGWRLKDWDVGALIAGGILIGLFLVLLLINVVQGPTCVAYLRTAVHLQPLPSLHRVRTAMKALRLLRPHVEAAQGTLSREQLVSFSEGTTA